MKRQPTKPETLMAIIQGDREALRAAAAKIKRLKRANAGLRGYITRLKRGKKK